MVFRCEVCGEYSDEGDYLIPDSETINSDSAYYTPSRNLRVCVYCFGDWESER